MLQVGSPILNFLLLVLKISLDLSLNAGYKNDGFSEILLKKRLEFVLNKEDGIVTFNLGLILLLAKVDPISKEQIMKGMCWGPMVLAVSKYSSHC